jgi:formamidopyrimidine-DNA glycosylase
MPELPEVETIRRDLQKKIVGKKIADVLILDKRTVKSNLGEFKKALVDNKFVGIERRGKLLVFELSKLAKSTKLAKLFLLVHLKMTGQMIYLVESKKYKVKSRQVIAGGHSLGKKQNFDLPDKFTKVVLSFADGSKLFFNDMRVFGYMRVVNERAKQKIVTNDFGVEPLEFKSLRVEEFLGLIGKRKIKIKAFLMDQKIIAGIGNIYADEICFCAGVKPSRRVDKLSESQIKKIFVCIPKILKLAIKHRGTTFNNYVDSDGNKGNFVKLLKVYGRGGLKCQRCGGIIKKVKQGGRGTHFCPDCQR